IARQGPWHDGPIGGHVKDLETVVGGIDREEMRTVGRQCQRPHLTALELDEGGRAGHGAGHQQAHHDQSTCEHRLSPGSRVHGTAAPPYLGIVVTRTVAKRSTAPRSKTFMSAPYLKVTPRRPKGTFVADL